MLAQAVISFILLSSGLLGAYSQDRPVFGATTPQATLANTRRALRTAEEIVAALHKGTSASGKSGAYRYGGPNSARSVKAQVLTSINKLFTCAIALDGACFLDRAEDIVDNSNANLLREADAEVRRAHTGRQFDPNLEEEELPSNLISSIAELLLQVPELLKESISGVFRSAKEGDAELPSDEDDGEEEEEGKEEEGEEEEEEAQGDEEESDYDSTEESDRQKNEVESDEDEDEYSDEEEEGKANETTKAETNRNGNEDAPEAKAIYVKRKNCIRKNGQCVGPAFASNANENINEDSYEYDDVLALSNMMAANPKPLRPNAVMFAPTRPVQSNGTSAGREVGGGRGKKKKQKKKAIIKLILLGLVLKAKITLLLKILAAKLQIKFLLIAAANLLINLARFWWDLKKSHQEHPQKVIYYEHAQHQHHYDGAEDWQSSPGNGGYWARSYEEENRVGKSAQDMAYSKQIPYEATSYSKANENKLNIPWHSGAI